MVVLSPEPAAALAAADTPRGRARLLGDGILYAAAGLVSASQRHAATIVIGLGGQPMTIWTPRGTVQGELLVVRPLVLIDLEPNHTQYRAFHGVNTWPEVSPRWRTWRARWGCRLTVPPSCFRRRWACRCGATVCPTRSNAPPSHFFPAQRTAMDDQSLPDWIDWHLARRPPGLEPLPLPDRGPAAKNAALP